MIKLIAIVGKSGSGKDTVLRKCLSLRPDLNKVIAYTTRPMRENETEGVDYKFVTPMEFLNKLNNKKIVEYSIKKDWYYGTDRTCYDEHKVNIGVFDVSRLPYLLANEDFEVTVVMIHASDKTRIIRQLNRENEPDVDEILRRYENDKKDFRLIEFTPDLVVDNDYYVDIETSAHKILDEID